MTDERRCSECNEQAPRWRVCWPCGEGMLDRIADLEAERDVYRDEAESRKIEAESYRVDAREARAQALREAVEMCEEEIAEQQRRYDAARNGTERDLASVQSVGAINSANRIRALMEATDEVG